jgi:NAD(P)-dependent dehydrogenase (short-subunit alcohol dehydrogenase family)
METTMQTVMITGANRGIGLEHVRRYAERGVRVFAAARMPEEADELAALAKRHGDQVEILTYDATDDDAPAALKDRIGAEPLDLMFANAGAMGARRQSFGDVDVTAVLSLIHVNALAPLKLAEALADNVARSERKIMAFQTSLMGSITDNGSGGAYAYRLSKSALNMVGKGVANDLRSRGVISVLLHPARAWAGRAGRSAWKNVSKANSASWMRSHPSKAAASSTTMGANCHGENRAAPSGGDKLPDGACRPRSRLGGGRTRRPGPIATAAPPDEAPH